jgi:hypothetical protein
LSYAELFAPDATSETRATWTVAVVRYRDWLAGQTGVGALAERQWVVSPVLLQLHHLGVGLVDRKRRRCHAWLHSAADHSGISYAWAYRSRGSGQRTATRKHEDLAALQRDPGRKTDDLRA